MVCAPVPMVEAPPPGMPKEDSDWARASPVVIAIPRITAIATVGVRMVSSSLGPQGFILNIISAKCRQDNNRPDGVKASSAPFSIEWR